MRILIVCRTFFPYVKGGAELHSLRAAEHLAKKHSVSVLFEQPNIKEEKDSVSGDFQGIPIRVSKWGFIYILVGFVRLLRLEQKFDVIHAHTALSPMVLGWLFSTLIRRPLVVTAHGSDVRRFGRTRLRYLQKFIFQFSSLWTCVSAEIQEFLVSSLGFSKSKLKVIRNGFDDNLLKHKDTSTSVSTICSIGSLRITKSPKMLIYVVDSLRTLGIDIRLLIVGDGPLYHQLQNLIESRGLSSYVQLLGARPHSEAMELLASSHIFLMTSTQEGFPIALMEAMALAKAVVVPNVGGIPEIIRNNENGCLFPPLNLDEAVKSITELMKSESLRLRLGKEARASVHHLGWSSIADAYESAYADLLSNASRAFE